MDGLDIIAKTEFYSNKSEKTKLNWFCYELALAFYDDLKKLLKVIYRSKGISESEIAKFSIQAALNLKNTISDFSNGKINVIEFENDFFTNYFSDINQKSKNKILAAMKKAWDDHLAICKICPTKCIAEKDSYCTMFDSMY